MVLIPVVHQFGVNGVLMVGLLAGGVLVVAAFCRLGRAARYLPAPVIEGFTAGIAVVIILQQVPAMLGTAGHGDKAWQSAFDSLRNFVQDPTLASPMIAVAVAGLILLAARFRPGIPASLGVIIAVTVVVSVADIDVAQIGALPAGLPAPEPWVLRSGPGRSADSVGACGRGAGGIGVPAVRDRCRRNDGRAAA